MARKDGMTSMRLPKKLIEELDAEVELLSQEPEYRAVRITRGVAINMAIRDWLKARRQTRQR